MGGRLLLSACTAAAALTALPRSAEPCAAVSGIDAPVVIPEDGATDIPTNSRVFVEWTGADPCSATDTEAAVVVREQGGAEIDTAIERFCGQFRYGAIVSPTTPLSAGASYEILTRAVAPGCRPGDAGCLDGPLEVVATFVTGDTADDQAPVFGGLSDVAVNFDACGEGCTCDFEWQRIIATLIWSAATDDTPASMLRYNVYLVGVDTPIERLTSQASNIEFCDGNDVQAPITAGFYGPAGDYYVRAVDLAGNEDDNTVTRNITLDCSTWPADPDAGPDVPDANPAAPDAGANTDAPSDGCCAVTERNPASSIALALLVLIALLRRRSDRCPRDVP